MDDTVKDKQIEVLLKALIEIKTFPRYRMPADIAKEAIKNFESIQNNG